MQPASSAIHTHSTCNVLQRERPNIVFYNFSRQVIRCYEICINWTTRSEQNQKPESVNNRDCVATDRDTPKMPSSTQPRDFWPVLTSVLCLVRSYLSGKGAWMPRACLMLSPAFSAPSPVLWPALVMAFLLCSCKAATAQQHICVASHAML